MAQPDPIDTLLDDLHQSTGNLLTMIGIIRQLRRSQRQLLPALRTMLQELCEQIEAALPELPPEEDTAHE
jgi:hypothetical protein